MREPHLLRGGLEDERLDSHKHPRRCRAYHVQPQWLIAREMQHSTLRELQRHRAGRPFMPIFPTQADVYMKLNIVFIAEGRLRARCAMKRAHEHGTDAQHLRTNLTGAAQIA